MQENHSDCSWVAQHALVLGSSGHVKPDRIVPAKPAHSAIKSGSTHVSVKLQSICLAPIASAIKETASLRQWQHELRLLKEDQPDQCMRQSGPFLVLPQVDFKALSLK